MTQEQPDRTRVLLLLVVALWGSALVMLFLGFRLHLKPLIVAGALDALVALGATTLIFGGRPRD